MAKKQNQAATETDRCVITYYFDHKRRKIKTPNERRAMHHNSAVMRCINNMRLNIYGATYAVVFDESTAEEFATVHRNIKGSVKVDESQNPRDYMDPFRRKTWYAFIDPEDAPKPVLVEQGE